MKIYIINGPNLNLLGKREPEIYGKETFEQYHSALKEKYEGIELIYQQSNVEGELVGYLQNAAEDADGILLNAAAYTHTSVAIHDAISAISVPVIEIHISNIYRREEYRHKSIISGACKGIIGGLGLYSYQLGVEYFLNQQQ